MRRFRRQGLRLGVAVFFLFVMSVAVAGCGAGGTTTVIQQEAPTEAVQDTTATGDSNGGSRARIVRIERETEEAELEAAKAKKAAVQRAAAAKKATAKKAREAAAVAAEAAQESEEQESSPEPPNVIGLPLPAAETQLRAAGFATAARNTDTLFGIVVKSHYTVCEEGQPRGNVVPVLAQKYGC